MHTHATAHDAYSSVPRTYTPPHIDIVAALAPYLHSLLRIGAGLLFMQHGLQKLFGLFGGFIQPGGRAELGSLMGLAGIFEFGGGILLALGLLTRPVALLLAGEMIYAYFTAHLPNGPFPIQNGGELALLYALVFLFLLGFGAGPLSVDSGLDRRPTVVR